MKGSTMRRSSTQDYLMTIKEQNPWHLTDVVPGILAPPTTRQLVNFLVAELQQQGPGPHSYSLILGPRRVGKTTVMYQTIHRLIESGVAPAKLWWLRIDHPLITDIPLGHLIRLLIGDVSSQGADMPILFLDEVMYAEVWDKWLKSFYDEHWPVRIVAASSATAALTRKSESGIGRWYEYPLRPCLLGEYFQLDGNNVSLQVNKDLFLTLQFMCAENLPKTSTLAEKRDELLCMGGFPELLLAKKHDDDQESFLLWSQSRLRSDAVEHVLHKDIPQLFGIDNPMSLERLLYILAGMVTGLISPGNIINYLGVSQVTFDRYISYLEKSFLVFTLPNYSGSERATQRRGRKLYFTDGAVRNAVLQRGYGALKRSPEIGLLYENMLASHLQALAVQTGIRLYHWRDGQYEVDFVYDHPDHPLAFEVAASTEHHQKGLLKLMEEHPKFRGGCYLVAENASIMSPPAHSPSGIGIIPLDWLLMAVSGQMETALAHAFGHQSKHVL